MAVFDTDLKKDLVAAFPGFTTAIFSPLLDFHDIPFDFFSPSRFTMLIARKLDLRHGDGM